MRQRISFRYIFDDAIRELLHFRRYSIIGQSLYTYDRNIYKKS